MNTRLIRLICALGIFCGLLLPVAGELSQGTFKNYLLPLFADKVNVRQEPNTTAPILETLPIGSEVHILEKCGADLVVNGYRQNWYKIRRPLEEKPVEGYIWGGFLPIALSSCDAGHVMVGITECGTGGHFTGEARLVCDGRILSRTPIEITNTPLGRPDSYDYTVEMEPVKIPGFPEFKDVFEVSYIYEACGYTNSQVLLFWDGKHLSAGPVANQVSEAGLFHVDAEFLFPGQEGCPKSQIWVKTTTNNEGTPVAEIRIDKYSWNGTTWTELPLPAR